jgi:site-specific recombinase XerD
VHQIVTLSEIDGRFDDRDGVSKTRGALSTDVDLWPGVEDPATLLRHIGHWLSEYGSHATRRTYAEGLGLPVSAADLTIWTRLPAGIDADAWTEAIYGYATAVDVTLSSEGLQGPQADRSGRTAPPPAARGRLRTLHWFRWCITQGVDPLTAQSSHVKTWLDALAGAEAAPATRDRMLGAVKSLYAYLADVGLATGNPAALSRRRLGLTATATSTSTTITLTTRQVRALYNTAGTPRRGASPLDTARAQAVVALFTLGLRVSELCNLDRADLHVTRGRRALRVNGKGGKIRIVYLSAPADTAVSAYLRLRDAATASNSTEVSRHRPGPHRQGPLLLTRTGRRYQRQAIWQLLRRITTASDELAEITDAMHPHALRHFYVTTAVEAGAQVVNVQADVGHTSVDTTEQTYNNAARDPGRSAVDLVANAWTGPQ